MMGTRRTRQAISKKAADSSPEEPKAKVGRNAAAAETSGDSGQNALQGGIANDDMFGQDYPCEGSLISDSDDDEQGQPDERPAAQPAERQPLSAIQNRAPTMEMGGLPMADFLRLTKPAQNMFLMVGPRA